MDSELVVGAIFVSVSAVLGVLGTSALVYVWFPRMRQLYKVLTAVLSLPIFLLGPIVALIVIESAQLNRAVSVAEDFAVAGVAFFLIALIGWPLSFLFVRALDRQKTTDWSVFE